VNKNSPKVALFFQSLASHRIKSLLKQCFFLPSGGQKSETLVARERMKQIKVNRILHSKS